MKSSSSNAHGKRPVGVDEDADVDDLDDVLDDFAPNRPAKPAPQTTAITQTTTDAPRPPAASTTTKSPDAEATNFMEALAIEMEEMVLQMEAFKDPSSSADGASASGADAGHDAAREKDIRAAWEELFANSMADIPTEAAAAVGGGGGGKSDAPGEPKDAFQKIRDDAAERLRKSDAEQAGPAPDDDLAALLDSGDDTELQKVLEDMMGQLMSRDVLYEPLKELNDKFPSYLSSNADKLSESDLARYQAQHECASKIITVFEDSEFRDDDPKMTEEIVGLMGKMQEHGAPPAEIMGELPPSLDLGPDGAPKLPDECVIG